MRMSSIEISVRLGVPLATVKDSAESLGFFATDNARISPEMVWKITSKLHADGHSSHTPLGTPPTEKRQQEVAERPAPTPRNIKPPVAPTPPRSKARLRQEAAADRARKRMRSPLVQEPKFIKPLEGNQTRPRSHRPVTTQLDKHVVRAIALTHKVPISRVLDLAQDFGVIATRDSRLPQATVERILDRLNTQPEQPVQTQHPEAALAERRAAIIRRDETDWSGLGFSEQTREYWIAAGVPANKAHIAAMCRESLRHHDSNVRINPQSLRMRLEKNETVLQALLSGQNYVRVLERIASRRELPLQGMDPHLLWLCASNPNDKESKQRSNHLAEILQITDIQAKSVPHIADTIAELVEEKRPDLEARVQFQQQIKDYFAGGEKTPQLIAYGKAFGVFNDKNYFDELLRTPRVQNVASRENLDALDTARTASQSENFFYVDLSATKILATLSAEPGFADDVMLPPAGFAILEGDQDSEIKELRLTSVLLWSDLETWQNAKVVFAPLRSLFTSSRNLETVETHSIDSPRSLGFRMLTSLSASRPNTTRGSSATDLEPIRPRPLSPSVDSKAGRSDGEVTVTYLAAFGEEIKWNRPGGSYGHSGPDHRWHVKGHFRMQWYPSENTHKRIFIKEHTSGPADRPLIDTRNVKVFRSR